MASFANLTVLDISNWHETRSDLLGLVISVGTVRKCLVHLPHAFQVPRKHTFRQVACD
jgi:hypothetical protein